MITVYPDYYNSFKCIADKCTHNCCIGWEIDIDKKSAGFYKTVKGTIGDKLRSSIEWKNPPHFILTNNERCPFLNESNLCDIMLNLGFDKVCDICNHHPRFYNYFADRTECGLGLCCEEAARIILGHKKHSSLILEGIESSNYKIIELRDISIKILQDDSFTIVERLNNLQEYFKIPTFDFDVNKWITFLLKLERLDDNWTSILNLVAEKKNSFDHNSFAKHMNGRMYEYEQLCVYLSYRYLINSLSSLDFKARILFISLSYHLIYRIGECMFSLNERFDFEDQVEIARMFSSEIEYSDENLDLILNELTEYI